MASDPPAGMLDDPLGTPATEPPDHLPNAHANQQGKEAAEGGRGRAGPTDGQMGRASRQGTEFAFVVGQDDDSFEA